MTIVSRRGLMGGSLMLSALSVIGAHAATVSRTGHRLIVGTRSLEVNGRATKVSREI